MTTPIDIAFIGGGNMATAIIGGLLRQGRTPASILVIDPVAEQRQRLTESLGVQTAEGPDAALRDAKTVVWAVKPQQFKDAAQTYAPLTDQALHYSVMAGLRTDDIARLLGTPRIVRAMPNTPALVGQGMTGLPSPVGGARSRPGCRDGLIRLRPSLCVLLHRKHDAGGARHGLERRARSSTGFGHVWRRHGFGHAIQRQPCGVA